MPCWLGRRYGGVIGQVESAEMQKKKKRYRKTHESGCTPGWEELHRDARKMLHGLGRAYSGYCRGAQKTSLRAQRGLIG